MVRDNRISYTHPLDVSHERLESLLVRVVGKERACVIRHTSAYVSIRHESLLVRVVGKERACVIRHTSAYVSIRQHASAYLGKERACVILQHEHTYSGMQTYADVC
jgi:hypothetical protein